MVVYTSNLNPWHGGVHLHLNPWHGGIHLQSQPLNSNTEDLWLKVVWGYIAQLFQSEGLVIGHLHKECKAWDSSTGIFFLTFRIVLASTLDSSCTKTQAPLDQAEKRVQAAFTQPVSVVFQNMSDSVKAIHLLPRIESQSILINGSTFRMDLHYSQNNSTQDLSAQLLSQQTLTQYFLCICVLG